MFTATAFAGTTKTVSATSTPTSVTLKWKATTKATKYVVYGSLGQNSLKKIKEIKKTSTTVKKVAGKSLKSNTTYRFRVKAYKGKKLLATSKIKTVVSHVQWFIYPTTAIAA